MFSVGMKRPIDEDDIYNVTNSMRSDSNTDEFAKLWDLELKKAHPSIFRVMLKLHGFKVLTLGLLFSAGETLARCVTIHPNTFRSFDLIPFHFQIAAANLLGRFRWLFFTNRSRNGNSE